MIPQHPILEHMLQSEQLTRHQVEEIYTLHQDQGLPIKEMIIQRGHTDEYSYLNSLNRFLETETISLSDYSPPEAARNAVPEPIARKYNIAPLEADHRTACLAIADLPSPALTDEFSFALSRTVTFKTATNAGLKSYIETLYGQSDQEPPDQPPSPVIEFVNRVLTQAVRARASDIHFEPFEHEFKIRYRVDGVLYNRPPPPASLAQPVISRIKVISGLDIAESRLPQDGRMKLSIAEHTIEFRVSTLPTRFGESVVLRVLDRSNMQLDINTIGFPDDIKEAFLRDIRKPHGIVVVTGPTGSGKTTTLYAALQHINAAENKILTAEDPIEYDVEGNSQLSVREHTGLTFASALRSFLRQDPDIIMVGEIRDEETAAIAIQAALTGHLVFTTLHTNDAAGAVTRLQDMKIEPYLIASTLESVLAQRLLRSICTECRSAYLPGNHTLKQLDLNTSQTELRRFFKGTGCQTCNQSGYNGRKAILEYMPVSEPLRNAIADQQPAALLRRKAMDLGMCTLRQAGIRSILNGTTTVNEVLQYT